MVHPLAGKAAPAELLIDADATVRAYYERVPDVALPEERVSFGTSGHRGAAEDGSFNELHIVAVAQAVAELRRARGVTGPLYLGKDTHALSRPAERTVLEVLAAQGVEVVLEAGDGYLPTPLVSNAIVRHNRASERLADGVVVTPSHNPPRDGGIKYNPPNGGPADTDVTAAIEARANELLRDGCAGVKRLPWRDALAAPTTRAEDVTGAYVAALGDAIELDAIRAARVRIGVDPLGGASIRAWERIAEVHGLDLTVVSSEVDPRFSRVPVDHDGKIRMDCSSPHAMAGLVALASRFDVAIGNDTDADRHGVVTPSAGLLSPNHFLAVAVEYLFGARDGWPKGARVGKTLVTSALVDRVARELGRELVEVPVGFKWFVAGLSDGTLGFGGEESAGASFLDRRGRAWSTDKDGLLLGLLAAEIKAKTGRDPGERYAALEARLGRSYYTRVDRPASGPERAKLKALTPEAITRAALAGDAITRILTKAPGNGASIGGLKVETARGWFAARPSGTEPIYKIYAESLASAEHLEALLAEATELVRAAIA
jgi:phosphoglucomutase